jgi:hypothetical protein
MEDITIRFNGGRYVASFDTIEDLTNWVRNSDLYQPFMYTIHGMGEIIDLDKFKKKYYKYLFINN